MKTCTFRILTLLTLVLALYGCGGGGGGDVDNPSSIPAPTITAFAMPATATSRIDVPITAFTATDSVGVTGYIITSSDKAPDPYGAGWTAWAPNKYTFPNAGPQTAYAWARNEKGGVSPSRSVNVVMPSAPVAKAVKGVVKNPAAGDSPLSGAVVKAYLHLAPTTQAGPPSVTVGADGSFSVTGLSAGVSYNLVFSKTGYRDITYFNVTPNTTTETVLPITVRMLSSTTLGQQVNINGYIKDVADYTGFKVTLQYRAGLNATDTSLESMTKATDLNGHFDRSGDYSVPAGIYTAEVVLSFEPKVTLGYVTIYAIPDAPSFNNSQYFQFPRTGVVADTDYKAVLNWGSTTADLDLIMTGPITGSVDRFHVDSTQFAYPAGTNSSNDPTIPGALTDAYLDINSLMHGTDNAPETLTILNKKAGTYSFYVYNASQTGTFASSGANVTLYTGSLSTKRSFTPPSGDGNVWYVFDLNGTTVTTKNLLITSVGDPSGTLPKQVAENAFEEYFLLRSVLNKASR